MNVFKGLVTGPVAEDFVEEIEELLQLEEASGVKPSTRVTTADDFDDDDQAAKDAQAWSEGWQSHWHKSLEESCEKESKYNRNI
jgi:hypothetical protein